MFFNRGQTHLDMIMLIIILFIVAMGAVLGNKILSDMNDEIQADADFSVEAKSASANVEYNYPIFVDSAYILMLVLFWILLLVSSFMIDAHPIFFAVMIILLIFVFIVGMALSNAYEEFSDETDIQSFADELPKINWVMNNLLTILIVIGFSTAMALYAKNRL